MPESALSAGQAEVHLWLCTPDDVPEELFARYPALLPEEEARRWAPLPRSGRQRARLLAHALLRTTVARYLGRAPESLRFRRTEYGRPQLEDAPGLEFNLSHTDGLVALAVTGAPAVGVDAEHVRQRDCARVVRRYFSPAERARLDDLAPDTLLDEFFRYWVLKEAYAKARGRGIALGFSSFSVSLAGEACSVEDARQDGEWWLALLRPTPEHRLGVAARDLPSHPGLRLRWSVPLGGERPATAALLAATTSPRNI